MSAQRQMFAVVVLLAGWAVAAAPVVLREGLGEAAVGERGELAAFEEAKERALRDAIEQAAGVRLVSDSLVVNSELVRDQVFAASSGYVKRSEVLDRSLDKGVARVRVRAEIIVDQLEQDIAASRDLVRRAGRPSLVILIQEQTASGDGKTTFNSDTVSTVLSEAFKADGYEVKDPAFAQGRVRLGAVIGPAEAKELGDLTKARYILYGAAAFRQQPLDGEGQHAGVLERSPMFLVTGEYELSLFSTDDGTLITKVSEPLRFDKVAHATQHALVSYEYTSMALVKQRREAIVAGVRRGILEHLRDRLVNGQALQLTVSGIDSFGAAKEFQRAVEAVQGAKDVRQDMYGSGRAAYRLFYTGSPQALAERLEAATFKRRKLNVVSVSGSALELQVLR